MWCYYFKLSSQFQKREMFGNVDDRILFRRPRIPDAVKRKHTLNLNLFTQNNINWHKYETLHNLTSKNSSFNLVT